MSAPRISIGVPVYNGALRLADALHNMLGQSLADIEVIVSDNASTDASPRIAEALAARDPRLRLIRQPRNLGPLANFQAVAEAARAPRFLWRADDDLCSPDFVARLDAALSAAPDAWLAVPRRVKIRIGRPRRAVTRVPADIARRGPESLLAASNPGWMYGLMPTGYAQQTIAAVIAEYGHVWAWDHLMIFPAIAAGRVTGDDRALFFHRLETRAGTAARTQEAADQMRTRFRAFCETRAPDRDARLQRALDRRIRRHFGPASRARTD